MTHDPKTPVDFDALVQTAIREGKDGRAEIVRQLCALPLERLAAVPASALALIGPEGLAALAARRAEFAGLAPKPGPMLGSSPATATKRQRTLSGAGGFHRRYGCASASFLPHSHSIGSRR